MDTRVDVPTDAGITPDGRETPDAAPTDSADVPVVPADVTAVPDASMDALDVADVSDVLDAPAMADVPDVMDVVDARALQDAPDVVDVPDVQDARDVSDVPDATDASDASDATDVTDATDVVDVPVIPMDLGPPPCLPGQDRCGGVVCLNLSTNLTNCGGCGNICPARPRAPATCSGGACTLVCDPGTLNCDGNLTNGCETTPSTDALNCGGCGMVCPSLANTSPSMCMGGVCSFGCGAGYANCNGILTDGCEVSTATDPSNCGACGRACGAGQTCTSGTCMCSTGWPACGGACPNLYTDSNNCGSCAAACGTGQGCCTGTCRDFQTDRFNCGGCGMRCPGTSTCISGECVCPGGAGFSICGGLSGTCVNRATDPNNCGWCGHVCPGTARRCVNYMCVP